jgi:hypothetical protein
VLVSATVWDGCCWAEEALEQQLLCQVHMQPQHLGKQPTVVHDKVHTYRVSE